MLVQHCVPAGYTSKTKTSRYIHEKLFPMYMAIHLILRQYRIESKYTYKYLFLLNSTVATTPQYIYNLLIN